MRKVFKFIPWFVFFAMVVFVLFRKKPFSQLNTTWAIVEYHDDEISYPEDLEDSFIIFNCSMEIGGSKIYLNLENYERHYSGKYRHIVKEGKEYLELYEFNNENLNGTYNLFIEQTVGTPTSKKRTYQLILDSEKALIIAERGINILF